MAGLSGDIVATLETRLQAQLDRWQSTIEGPAWQGTPTELALRLNAVGLCGDMEVRNPSRAIFGHEEFFRDRGWLLSLGRTKSSRWIRVERAS